jgi:membrane protein
MNRGRHAESPTEIPALGWKDIGLRVKDAIAEDHVTLIAAGVAFYALLALFPAIAAFLAIAGLVFDPERIVAQIESMSGVLPGPATEIVIAQAREVAGGRTGGLGAMALIGVALAFYSASKGVGSLMEGLNVAYDETETRGLLRLKATALALTILLIVGFAIGIAVTLALPAALSILAPGLATGILISAGGLLVMLTAAMIGLAVLYRLGPCRANAEWRWTTPGAAVACIAWILASAGFAVYVANFGSYNESFGSLGGVVVLLLWLWISALVVLVGAEINGEMEAQTRYDTTTGPDAPMGERGARKADTLGDARG